MSRRVSQLLALLSMIFCGQFVGAAGVSTTIHHLYQSPRAMGMGDAFVAVADDYSAIFYNPAGLARREDGQINLSMSYAGTPGAMTFYDEYSKIESSKKSETEKQTEYLNLIQRHYGDVYSLRLSPLEGVWVRPFWGVALIPADITVELAMHQQVGPAMYTTAYVDTTLAFSYAQEIHDVLNGRFSWGITPKFVNRGFFSKAISATDLAVSTAIVKKEDLIEGYTVDADIGFMWTPLVPDSGFFSAFKLAHPTFGFVARNVGDFGFAKSLKLVNKETQTERPEKLYRVYDVGSKWEYPSLWIFGGRGVLDIRDIGHPDFNWRKSIHAGVEFDWTVTSWWKGHYRAGLSESFWTAGLSAEFTFFNLDIVSYANDVGTRDRPVESRVYATRLNMDF